MHVMHSQTCQARVCTLWLSHDRSNLLLVATHSIVHIMCTLEMDDTRHDVFTYALSDYRVSANTPKEEEVRVP